MDEIAVLTEMGYNSYWHSAEKKGYSGVAILTKEKPMHIEFGTHIDYMDRIAEGFDFNNHAMLRFQQQLKDAVDPQGIIAPGKQGVWPARFR